MYVNPRHRLSDREALFDLVASHPLGAWVCLGRDGLVANHVPFLLDRSRGPYGTLIGHVARANTVWRELEPGHAVGGDVPRTTGTTSPRAGIRARRSTAGSCRPGTTWWPTRMAWRGRSRTATGCSTCSTASRRFTRLAERRRGASTTRLPRSSTSSCAPSSASRCPSIGSKESSRPARTKNAQDRAGTVRGLQDEGSDEAGAMADLVMRAIESGQSRPITTDLLGSAAPDRDLRLQSFGPELVAVVGRDAATQQRGGWLVCAHASLRAANCFETNAQTSRVALGPAASLNGSRGAPPLHAWPKPSTSHSETRVRPFRL